MYRIEKGKAFYVVLKIFSLFGCLPSANGSRFLYVLKYITRILPIVFWSMIVHHFIMSVKNGITVKINEDLTHIFTYGGITMMPILFKYNRRKWLKLFKDVTAIDIFGKPPNYESIEIYGNLLSTIYLYYVIVGLVFYCAIALLTLPSCRKLNTEKNLHEICIAIGAVWLPSFSNNLFFEISLFAAQLITALVLFSQAVAVDILPLIITELIISHIGHFTTMFNGIFKDEDRNVSAKLGVCIEYHCYILRMASDLSDLSKVTLGYVSLISAIAIGCCGNLILQEANLFLDLRVGAYVVGFTVALFILCHSGQKLTNETSSIQDALYCANWYLCDTKRIRDVQLMILRSQKPVGIEALPRGCFDYSLFLMIIKSAYSYLTLLSETTK